jgi:hypothetical protein
MQELTAARLLELWNEVLDKGYEMGDDTCFAIVWPSLAALQRAVQRGATDGDRAQVHRWTRDQMLRGFPDAPPSRLLVAAAVGAEPVALICLD